MSKRRLSNTIRLVPQSIKRRLSGKMAENEKLLEESVLEFLTLQRSYTELDTAAK